GVAGGAVAGPQLLQDLGEPVEGGVVLERAGHEPDAGRQPRPHLLPPRGAGVPLGGLARHLGEALVVPVAPREPDQTEPGWQQAAVAQVVDGRDELAVGEVPGRTEDHQGSGFRDAGQPAVVRVAQRVHVSPRAASVSAARPSARSRRCTRSSGRPRRSSACRSPAACAACSCPNVYGRSGTARSSVTTPVICRNDPTCGPPLWYWPVECRYRGPHPKVTGRGVAAASAARRPAASASATGSRNAVTARYPRGSTPATSSARASRSEPARVPYSSTAPSTASGRSGCGPRASRAAVFSLDSVTFGWSNGLTPSTRPSTAVAYSQARNCAP